jgi:hypothetical protein
MSELRFLGRRVPECFEAKLVTLAPGEERSYDAREWNDAVVAVEQGDLELECLSGACRRFAAGSVLWLSDLPLRALRNTGLDSVLLVAVSREHAELGATVLHEPMDGPAGRFSTIRDTGGAPIALWQPAG